ncbi:MAG TPA: NfeD family protein [Gemmatimonadales bacterium]|jgi:membrane-bound serine protease (ClpP class)
MRPPLFLTLALLLSAAPAAGQSPVVYRISVSGTVENGLAPYVARTLREAEASGAAAAYLDIDTPGGRVDAAERISDAVRRSTLPVYAFVNPRAFSAGALIAISAREVYMRPGAVLGAATPVDGEGQRASEKMVSAMRAEFRAVAEERRLDPRIAEAMVDEEIEIPGLDGKTTLLTLTSGEAIKVGYAKGEVADQAALLRAIGLPSATVVSTAPNWAEQIVRFLTDPLVSPLLLSLGVLGLVLEIKSGAFGIGGLVSVAALGLFFGSSFLLGLAGWEEVLLLGLGLIALAVEAFVIPGFGVAGFLGLGAIAAAIVLALIGAAPTGADVLQAFAILGASLVITAAVVYAWLRHLPNSNRFGGLFLRGGMAQAEGYISAPPRADLVGQEGVAVTDLRPAGTAAIAGERVDVVTEGEFVRQGSAVRVLRSEGYRHVVRGLS